MKKQNWLEGVLILACALFLCACGTDVPANGDATPLPTQAEITQGAEEQGTPTPKATTAPTVTEMPVAKNTPVPTVTPTSTPTPTPTNTPIPTPTPFPESEEPGTEYAAVGTNGENFKLYMDEEGRLLTQRYYDAEGNFVNRAVVTSDEYGMPVSMECYNSRNELVGTVTIVYYSAGQMSTAAVDAKEGAIVAAVAGSVAEDGTLLMEVVQAEEGTQAQYFYQNNVMMNRLVLTFKEDGKPDMIYGYDAAGELMADGTYTYHEDGSCTVDLYAYANGEKVQHQVQEMDAHGNVISYAVYDSAGNVIQKQETENEYYEDGTLKKKATLDTNGNVIRCEEYDEQGNQIAYSRYSYDTEGNVIYGDVTEYYSNGVIKKSEYYNDGNLQSRELYNEQGTMIEREYWNYSYSTGEFRGHTLQKYDEMGETILRVEYDAYNNITGYEAYAFVYDEDGRIAERRNFAQDNTVIERVLYRYHENGQIAAEIQYTGEDDFEYYSKYAEDGTTLAYAYKDYVYNAESARIFTGYYMYEADINGNDLLKAYYDTNGNVTSKYVYEYDANGKITAEYYYGAEGLESKKIYEREEGKETVATVYDGDDRMTERIRYNLAGKRYLYERFYYDDNGKLSEIQESESLENGHTVSRTYEYENGKLQSVFVQEYSYDTEFKTHLIESYDGEGNLLSRSEYDGNGKRTESFGYTADGTQDYYAKYNENGIQVYRMNLMTDWYGEKYYDVEEFNDAGEIILETHYDLNNTKTYMVVHNYFENGKEQIFYHYEDGEVDTIGYRKYENGNIVMDTGYVTSTDGVFKYYRLTKYDAKGNVISEKNYDKNWNPMD